MAKRIKSDKQLIPIANWDQADKYIKQIGEMQLYIAEAKRKANDSINQTKTELATAVKPFQKKTMQLIESLEAFAATHKTDFGKDRSKKLNFGTLGWRKSTSIIIKKTKDTLRLLRETFGWKGAEPYIRKKEEVDKEALARLTDGQLVKVGARRRRTEPFFVEPDLPEAVDYRK